MASEVEATGVAIHTEDGNVVSALIATIEELPGGVKIEAARVVSTCPFFPDKCQGTVWPNRKNPDAVVQSVACIDKLSIG